VSPAKKRGSDQLDLKQGAGHYLYFQKQQGDLSIAFGDSNAKPAMFPIGDFGHTLYAGLTGGNFFTEAQSD